VKASTLWNDVDALARLALSERGVSEATRGGHEPRAPLPQSAFPPFAERRDFKIHSVGAPARVVSGDYCDAFLLSENTLAVVMADVSGKGAPAALLMGILRSMVRNVSTFSASPGDTLARVNRMLYDAHLGPMYVTIFLGWYNTGTGTLRYANAGHPHPYRIDREGRASKFGEVTGPILGILDVKEYENKDEQLGIGERLLLYTDGITEAHSTDGKFLGSDCLTSLLEEHAAEPIARMCERIVERVGEFQNDRLQDDVTLLALQRDA
jgi:sigma-B regulation protein RsbU (phosphoserine phosphatase)